MDTECGKQTGFPVCDSVDSNKEDEFMEQYKVIQANGYCHLESQLNEARARIAALGGGKTDTQAQ